MPLDATCPACRGSFPVTEARSAFTVACPACDAELTVEFRKPHTPPEAGQPHYDLLVRPGALAGPAPPPPAKRRRDADEDDEPKRGGGSALVVLLSGGFGLLVVLGGLGLTAWVLFGLVGNTPGTAPNRPQPKAGPTVRPSPGPVNPGPVNPGPGVPPTSRDEFDLRPQPGTPQPITPPPLDLTSPAAVALPAAAEAVSVGGNGRYVVFHLPSTNQLAYLDASVGKVTPGPVLPTSGRHLVAAGQNRVAVYAPGNVLRVYELPGLRHLYDTAARPLFHGPHALAMGSATNGPVLACDPFGEVVLLELGPAAAKEVEGSRLSVGGEPNAPVRAAANGRLFVRGEPGGPPALLAESGRRWKLTTPALAGGYPAADGRHVLGAGAIVGDNGQAVGPRGGDAWYVPATSGTSFLKVTAARQGGRAALSASVHRSYADPDREKAVPVPLPELGGLADWALQRMPLDQHLFLIPEAQLLVTLNAAKDKLTLRRVDVR